MISASSPPPMYMRFSPSLVDFGWIPVEPASSNVFGGVLHGYR